MEEKVTIIDVANKAGVSKGTVDRVVHGRGEVSKKSTAKVLRAIEELGYQPNLHASLLASRNVNVIACLLPEFSEGEYWGMINQGFILGGEQVASLGVRTRAFYYNQYDEASFKAACTDLLGSDPSAVLLPPLFMSDTVEFASELHRRGIPYAYVDSKLEEDNYFVYYGMPMYSSGSLCAALLTERCTREEVDEVAVIRIHRDKAGQSDPSVGRRTGFMDYMGSHFPKTVIHNVFINPAEPGNIYRTLDDFFRDHPAIRFVVTFNSRVYLVNNYLADHPVPGRRVIGFDNLEQNVRMLREGTLSIIITQHTENQSKFAVIALADWLLMRKRPEHRDNYMHMDILTRYNVDNY